MVRRVIAARVRNPEEVSDLAQETLTRVFEARDRLDDEALMPYAIVTARNLVVSQARRTQRHKRHAHRLIDLREPQKPDEQVIRQEERRAVSTALNRLQDRDRDAVVAHELHGVDTGTLAREMESTPGGVAVRLARARARLRVEYLLAMSGEPPTPRCRPVLMALAAGDRRRQLALDTGTHLLECDHCGGLSKSLLQRRSGLAAFLPLGGIASLVQTVRHAARIGRVQATVAAATAGTAGIVIYNALQPAPPAPIVLPDTKRVATLVSGSSLERHAGRRVEVQSVVVDSVLADEGFWLGSGRGKRLWIELAGRGESGFEVEPGDVVTFTGRLVRHGSGFVEEVDLSRSEGAAELRHQSIHVRTHRTRLEFR